MNGLASTICERHPRTSNDGRMHARPHASPGVARYTEGAHHICKLRHRRPCAVAGGELSRFPAVGTFSRPPQVRMQRENMYTLRKAAGNPIYMTSRVPTLTLHLSRPFFPCLPGKGLAWINSSVMELRHYL